MIARPVGAARGASGLPVFGRADTRRARRVASLTSRPEVVSRPERKSGLLKVSLGL